MLGAYKKTLLALFSDIQRLSPDPHSNAELSLEIQENLIRRITYVEHRIRILKAEIREYRRELGTRRGVPFSKQEAKQIKQAIDITSNRIERYNEIVFIFRSIGDAIAHTYISKWDIKPMAFKESPGFISGKKGNRLERKILRRTAEMGITVILNDLTNCLRFGDLTVPRGDGPFLLIEAKTPNKNRKSLNQRGKRQLEAMNKINDYLATDQSKEFYGYKNPIMRFSADEERNHIDRLNELIDLSFEKREAFDEVEDGLFYFTSTRFNDKSTIALESLLRRCKEPILGFAHEFKYESLGYYPFTLSIKNPQALYRLYLGSFVIVIIVDAATIKRLFASQGFSVEIRMGEERPLLLHASGFDAPISVGIHMLNRLFSEFTSLEWLVQGLAAMAKSADSMIAEFSESNPEFELNSPDKNEAA